METKLKNKPLSEVKIGKTVELVDFSKEPSVYFTLSSLGILQGDQLLVIAKAPFGGPISLKYGTNTYFALRKSHTTRIYVKE